MFSDVVLARWRYAEVGAQMQRRIEDVEGILSRLGARRRHVIPRNPSEIGSVNDLNIVMQVNVVPAERSPQSCIVIERVLFRLSAGRVCIQDPIMGWRSVVSVVSLYEVG